MLSTLISYLSREHRGLRLFSMLTIALLAAQLECGDSSRVETDPVGSAPLRRLSNSEYLNALADLFPASAIAVSSLPPLPADSEVAGFSNAAEAQQPSDLRIARFEQIANLYAAALAKDAAAVHSLVGCDYATPTEGTTCANKFVREMGSRVFRRPLSIEEQDRLSVRFAGWQADIDFEAAVQLTIASMLQSPQFLYRPEVAPRSLNAATSVPLEPYAMASRLSFFLWESVPDDALFAAAAKDELRTEEQLRAQGTRMLANPRARRSIWSFHRQWLGLDRILSDEHNSRTEEVDPLWSAQTPVAASHESRLFIENVLGNGGTLRDLFLSRRAFVNGDLARIYGIEAPADPNSFVEVLLPEGQRAGVLTRVAFLAGYSHRGATSPPVRGNGLGLRLLCRLPFSPPPDADLSQPMASPGDGPKTNRALFEARTAPTSCMSCHRTLNGVGFAFENFNAAGAFQTSEQGLPIDARGTLVGTDIGRPIDGALDMSSALSESKDVQRCATERWVRYALGRAPESTEQPLLAELRDKFGETHGDIAKLMLDIVTSKTFRLQRATPTTAKFGVSR